MTEFSPLSDWMVCERIVEQTSIIKLMEGSNELRVRILVRKLGPDVEDVKVGDEVLLNPQGNIIMMKKEKDTEGTAIERCFVKREDIISIIHRIDTEETVVKPATLHLPGIE